MKMLISTLVAEASNIKPRTVTQITDEETVRVRRRRKPQQEFREAFCAYSSDSDDGVVADVLHSLGVSP